MKADDQLSDFVARCLRAGKSRDDIRAALTDAGWSASEVEGALSGWADTDFAVPVPRPRSLVTARDFFVYGLMALALALSAIHIVILMFNLIDIWIEDPSETYRGWRDRTVRWSIAYLVVFGPLFLLMDRSARNRMQSDPAVRRSAIRKWFGYIALFAASVALLGDLIWAIYELLSGDLTARVLAKVVVVAVVAGAVFLYYRSDLAERGNG